MKVVKWIKINKDLNSCNITESFEDWIYITRTANSHNSIVEAITFQSKTQYLPNNVGREFPDLIALSAQRIGLEKIGPYFFMKMNKLEYLFLGYNDISELAEGVFKNLTGLKYLDLSNNKLRKIKKIGNLNALQFLDLSKNSIVSIDPDIFGPIQSLKGLNLGRNPISEFVSVSFKSKNDTEPDTDEGKKLQSQSNVEIKINVYVVSFWVYLTVDLVFALVTALKMR